MSWTIASEPEYLFPEEVARPGEQEQVGHSTAHYADPRQLPNLTVAHLPHSQVSHRVSIRDSRHHLTFEYPSRADGHRKAFIYSYKPYHAGGTYVDPPSEELQMLIRSHHEQPGVSWMPLLDKLAEEYPERFGEPVTHHTALRLGGHT